MYNRAVVAALARACSAPGRWVGLLALWAFVTLASAALGAPTRESDLPRLDDDASLAELGGRPLRRVEVRALGTRWREAPPAITSVRADEPLSGEVARRAMTELLDTGRWASADATAEPAGDGAVLVITVVPRRVITALRIAPGALDEGEVRAALGVEVSSDVTEPQLTEMGERVRKEAARRGFPGTRVAINPIDTDDPLLVVLDVVVDTRGELLVSRRRFHVAPRSPALDAELGSYAVTPGDRADEELLDAADRELEARLHAAGWFQATVDHALAPASSAGSPLDVTVRAGARLRVVFEGQRTFDAEALEDALALEDNDDRSASALVERVRAFYVTHGFLDAQVTSTELGRADHVERTLVLRVRERDTVRVARRLYPCLAGPLSAADVGQEIDSFLSELPGAGVFGTVDPRVTDDAFGPAGTRGVRVVPHSDSPYTTYVPEVYDRAVKHVADLYRAEGYLGVVVGPARLLRRQCDPSTPPDRCVPLGEVAPSARCLTGVNGQPVPEPDPPAASRCVPDPARGVRCEPVATLSLPVQLGPRTTLYDLAFEGNVQLVEQELAQASELALGAPLSQVEIDKARRRLLDAYADRGFAFATVEAELDFSPDRTRARARFVITEHELVRVSAIVVRGARATDEKLILRRVALRVGAPYSRKDVRLTEERLATLGVFATVTVGFEDPYVPAREKVVVITVQEKKPQYLDVRPGFSTGEGFRAGFEYGHRNLGGQAIQLTLRVQLGYLPPALVLDEDVRRKYDELDVGSRLERRNSATIEFPDIGLGPWFRLSVEGVDVRDNARDFGLTKDAGIVTLSVRPNRRVSAQIGASLERNNAEIFGDREKSALSDYVQANPGRAGAFRVPAGTTRAVAERIGLTWDRRDNAFAATSGTLASVGVEHVRADPVGETAQPFAAGEVNVFAPTTSQFLRFSGRVAGYLRLSKRGLSFAASLRAGFNQQLLTPCRELAITDQALGKCSQTYPDRLFFLGGVDSLRGFTQDSLVPEDVARRLLDPSSGVTLDQVVVRGGDLFLNPRLELRIPLSPTVQTALFVDSGNLWVDPRAVEPFDLRYATGSGLRINTPVGPLVFDYGFNVSRVFDALVPSRKNQRTWEDLGAFHFSIGLF